MITKGIKSANQIQMQNKNGEPMVPVIGDKGGMLVEIADGELDTTGSTTLHANIMTLNTEEQSIGMGGKKVTTISIANYSETANVTIDVDGTNYVIGPNIATDLLINKKVTTIMLSATEADTKVQYIIEGVE